MKQTRRGTSFRSAPAWLAALSVTMLTPLVAQAARPVAGAVTSERLKVPSGPSSVRGLAGEPTVDPYYGRIGYEVPIEVPAGWGGLAPSLALSYSGSLGNGALGIGWTLGIAEIRRATRQGIPSFDGSDELELAGQGRLVAIGGEAYRVEGMGQTVRVRKVGDGFEVDDGSGVRMRFGVSAAARQESDAAHTVAWRLEEVTNQAGERVRYEYERDQQQLYLTRVTWGPGDGYRVELTYETRTDATTSYRDGFKVVTAKRLARIAVEAFGVERRAYQLSYDSTFAVSRLAGVTSTGVTGQGSWPALTFTYAAPAAPSLAPVSGMGDWRLNVNGTSLVDLDGDGAAELLQMSASGHRYLSNRDGLFGELQPLGGNTQGISVLQLQDLDGDARPELVQENASGWLVWKWSRTQWLSQVAALPGGVWPGTQGLPLKSPTSARFADLDGDGLVDAVQWNSSSLLVRAGTRTGFAAVVTRPRIGGTALPTSDGRFQDVNGDGLDDYVLVGPSRLDVFTGKGDGTFEPLVQVPYPLGGAWTPDNTELADLDRDGLVDLVRIDLGTVLWFRGKASGGFSSTAGSITNPAAYSPSTVVAVIDSNGNGSQDVVWSTTAGMWRMDLAGTTTAGMLTRVQNGLGMEATFEYASSHTLSAAARLAGRRWQQEVPIAMAVPIRKRTALGPGETTRDVRYTVRDGFWDAAEQRFGGFVQTVVTTAGATSAETASVSTTYLASSGIYRVLRGKPLNVQVHDGTGRRLSLTTYDWDAQVVSGLPDVPLLRRAVLLEEKVRHEDTTPLRETRTTYAYDAAGRQVQRVDHGRLDLTGDEAVTETTYADDDTTWVRDRVCEQKVRSITGLVVSHIQTLFGDETTVHPLGVVGKGWARETRAWLADEQRFVTQEQTAYDARGNPITTITGGVATTTIFDADGLFPVEERMTNDAGTELIWRATWDRTLGAIATATDPNGHTTTVSYDALGRSTAAAVDGRAPHQHIEYDWTPPYPRTTVWDFDGAVEDLGPRPPAWSATSGWRQTVQIANGLGDTRYTAVRLAADRWILSGYQQRDASGRVVFAGRPVYAAQLEHAAPPAGLVGDTLRYDPLGRLIEQTLPTGAVRQYAYTAFERTITEPGLAPVHSVLDGLGRPVLTERSLADGTHEIVQAAYDPAGHLTRMWLAGGAVERTFTYDSLGRLRTSSDPDLGIRTLTYDDGNRLTRETNAVAQSIDYTYDALGRLRTRTGGGVFTYHYDAPRPGAPAGTTNLAGRLAWIQEPTGVVDTGYDELGRPAFGRRQIDNAVSAATTTYAPSGLVRAVTHDDGFALAYTHDPAGRLVGIDDLVTLHDLDASGLAREEHAANGVVTTITRDALGFPSHITIRDAGQALVFDASAQRNDWRAITAIADVDGVGLDHSATFGYDGFARLTTATVGTGPDQFAFAYAYDGLHNMTSRTAAGPRAIGAFFGTYRHGDPGHAPRQLSAITDAAGVPTHVFDYDAAGRQIAQDDLSLSFDANDRLVQIDGLPAGSVTHTYGHDGQRLKTVAPDGTVQYFFGDGTSERAGIREHDVTVGGRTLARVQLAPAAAAAAAPLAGLHLAPWLAGLGVIVLALALLARLLGAGRPLVRRRFAAAGMIGLLLSASCTGAGPTAGAGDHHVVAPTQVVTHYHATFTAGPSLFTDADGLLAGERRSEPFGEPIDDPALSDLNALNQRSDAATGWSDHGARWMAPTTARWLSTDPPVVAPDATFMDAPWALHPYQYAHQNPISYWDPDGRWVIALPWLGEAAAAAVTAAAPWVGAVVLGVVGHELARSAPRPRFSEPALPTGPRVDIDPEIIAATAAATQAVYDQIARSTTRTVPDVRALPRADAEKERRIPITTLYKGVSSRSGEAYENARHGLVLPGLNRDACRNFPTPPDKTVWTKSFEAAYNDANFWSTPENPNGERGRGIVLIINVPGHVDPGRVSLVPGGTHERYVTGPVAGARILPTIGRADVPERFRDD